ncbi:MAG: hypothetical protein JXR95_07670 [Deltaproteobacteria bacterium]|nr:hypothetical protein [Deltaproteobacteria bacterium]
MKVKLVFFALLFMAVSCDPIEQNSDNNTMNNGTNNTNNNITNNTTNNTSNNTTTNNSTNNTTPGTCSVNDLSIQTECNPGYKCTITTVTGTIGCVEYGALSLGDACSVVSSGQTQDGCPVGSFCYSSSSDPTDPGQCTEFCYDLYTPCRDNGICGIELDLGVGSAYLCEPTDDCDPYFNTGCDAGESCYLLLNSGGITTCLPTPANGLLKGSSCEQPDDCAPKHTCFGPYQEETCHALCTTENSEYDCGIDYCVEISSESEYGVCWNE